MSKFKNKYRVESNRLRGWDYSNPGIYFITICTQHRRCNLGTIVNEEMILSEFGKIVNTQWQKSFELRNELYCDEYIIMPNHIHAIVVLKPLVKNDCFDDCDLNVIVEMHGRASLQSSHSPQSTAKPQLIRQSKSISSFIAGFKSAVNSKINDYIDKNNLDVPKYNRKNHFFQPNYHDHIIRDEQSYINISEYIINNPANWEKDKLFQ